jgi:hypothetical protein
VYRRESNGTIIKAVCIKYGKVLNKVIQESKKQIIIDLQLHLIII